MARKPFASSHDALIGTLLKARDQAMGLDETMAAYLIGMAIKAIEDRQVEGVPPGWDDGMTLDDDDGDNDGDGDDGDGDEARATSARSAA